MKALQYASVVMLLILGACDPEPKHQLWDCACAVTADGHAGNLTVPMWCDDTHDEYDNGAMMVSYCWSYMSIWWDPDEFTCDCVCEASEVSAEECY